jgi:hypothetical protein
MSIKRRLDALTKRLSEDLALCPTCGRPVNLEVWSGVLMVEQPPPRCPDCHHPVDTQGKPILVSIIMVMPGLNEGPTLDDLFFQAKGRRLMDHDYPTLALADSTPSDRASPVGE